jgi:hypothetical protein
VTFTFKRLSLFLPDDYLFFVNSSPQRKRPAKKPFYKVPYVHVMTAIDWAPNSFAGIVIAFNNLASLDRFARTCFEDLLFVYL